MPARARLPVLVPHDLSQLRQFLTTKLLELDAALGTLYQGTGTPEGVIAAPVGSLYERLDGVAGATLYVKESGEGLTGWTALGAAGLTGAGAAQRLAVWTAAAALSGYADFTWDATAKTLTVGIPSVTQGTGTPEGVVAAVVGSLYLRTDGAGGTTLYVKETGAGTTGWTALGAAGALSGSGVVDRLAYWTAASVLGSDAAFYLSFGASLTALVAGGIGGNRSGQIAVQKNALTANASFTHFDNANSVNSFTHGVFGDNSLWQMKAGGPTGTTRMTIHTGGRVRVGAGQANVTLDVLGGLALGFVNKAVNYTLTADDFAVYVDASGGARTMTLPASTDAPKIIYFIKKVDASANAVTIARSLTNTIDGATSLTLAAQWNGALLTNDAAGSWYVIALI